MVKGSQENLYNDLIDYFSNNDFRHGEKDEFEVKKICVICSNSTNYSSEIMEN